MAYPGAAKFAALPLARAIGCRSGRPDARDLSDAIALEAIFPIGEVEESFVAGKPVI